MTDLSNPIQKYPAPPFKRQSQLSYVPQIRKAWPRGSTADLSLTVLVALTCGLLLWIVYGVICGD